MDPGFTKSGLVSTSVLGYLLGLGVGVVFFQTGPGVVHRKSNAL
jgi:hypothetical protein